MLTIRLSRFGKKKHPIYRVVISEHQKDTVGNYLELLGQYNPHTDTAELKEDRIKYWISKGAQTSGTVHNLLVDKKIISADKIKVANIKKKKEDKQTEGETKPEAKETPKEKGSENKKKDPETSSGEKTSENKPTESATKTEPTPKEDNDDKK